jgi:hypothetical protein
VALGELDGDGDLDAFVVHSHARANRVWLNRTDVASANSSRSDASR